MEKLSYEEWRRMSGHIRFNPEMVIELEKFHGINAEEEIEKTMKQEYQWYLEQK